MAEAGIVSTPPLGYEGDTTLSNIAVAQVQLTEAIELFVQNKFLCAVTLAGAAEEILGKLLQCKFQLPTIRASTLAIQELRERTGLTVMDGMSEKEIIDDWNAARNALKHLVGSANDPITMNLCDEAYWMIKRALSNACKLDLPIANEQEFENWIIVNVNT